MLIVGLPIVGLAQWENAAHENTTNTDDNPFINSTFDGEGDPGLPGSGGTSPEPDNNIPFDGGVAVLLVAALYRRKATKKIQ